MGAPLGERIRENGRRDYALSWKRVAPKWKRAAFALRLAGDRRVIEDLHRVAVGIFAVERARAVAVRARLGDDAHAARAQVLGPRVDVGELLDDDPEVREVLAAPLAKRARVVFALR